MLACRIGSPPRGVSCASGFSSPRRRGRGAAPWVGARLVVAARARRGAPGAVARRADVVPAVAGGCEPLRAVALLQPQDAETGAEALLGMGLGLHDRLDQRDRCWPNLGGRAHPPGRRPLGIATV